VVKKVLFTLNIDYDTRITDLTYPLLRRYAQRIGAEVHVINTRQFPDWPVVYEKLQIQQLARDLHADWCFYIDSDALVHPETIDFTEFIPRDTVAHNGSDMAAVRWDYCDYFRRDGRNIGSCNWCTIASSWCLDLWTPLDISFGQALARIHPTMSELKTVITPEHLIDDFTLSRNIARYGLKFTTLMELLNQVGLSNSEFFWHQYVIDHDTKVEQMREVLTRWRCDG
jgi:hypothetical protein